VSAITASTVREALSAAADALEAAGCETPRLDAELLLSYATGWERAGIAANPEARLPVGASRGFGQMVRRRLQREPVAYIVGCKGFRRIEVLVDRRVLIPRPETELLVDVALELEPSSVLDVGTGSGAIALAVADEVPSSRVIATDTSFDAVRVAQSNAERLGLADRVDVVLRGVDSLGGTGGGPCDLLLANLPYVSEGEWEGLEPEIRDHEPRGALVAGPTGLELIETLTTELASMKVRPGAVALEIGAEQGDAVTELVGNAGYSDVEVRCDLAGLDRAVIGR
jgi:release factor glutamine methyltransferase